MQDILEPLVRQALGMTMAGLRQAKDLSAKDAAFIIASNFALCSASEPSHIEWSKIPVYVSEKEVDMLHWFERAPFNTIFAQISPPPVEVQRYCSSLLLPLLRDSHSLGSDLVASKIENQLVKGELPNVELLPSVISALAPAFKVSAVDVALALVLHFLPLAKSTSSRLQTMRVLYGIMACQAYPPPSDSSSEFVSLPVLLSEKLLTSLVLALKHEPEATVHLAAVSILNAALRLPQAVYLLRVKPQDWSALLKYCADIVGTSSSQRCVTSLAITAALRFMNCDPSAITISKCLLWHHPSKADHLFLTDRENWTNSQSLELSILTPFINSCIPPQLALVFASRMLAAVCDMDAPPPSEDNAQALRLPSLVSLFVGYASLVHLKAPINWMEHAKGVMTFWGARCAVDCDRVIGALKAMKDTCVQSQKNGSYTFRHLIPLFYNVLQQLQATVAFALNLGGDEGVDMCAALNDAAAPVMAWACDVASLAHAPAVAACFSAFASFSRRQCLDTDLIQLFSALKRFGEIVGSGELLPICKEIAEQLTDDDIGASTSLFPEQVPHDDVDTSSEAAKPQGIESEFTYELIGEDGDGDGSGSGGSPLAATPPPALHGASPLMVGDADEDLPLTAFSGATPQHAARPAPLLKMSSQNYQNLEIDEVNYHSVMSQGDDSHVNVDSVFAEVVSGLNSATAQAVKRAQNRHKARRAGRTEDDSSFEHVENDDAVGFSQKPASMATVSEAANDENVESNKSIVDRLANIELMLSRFIEAKGDISAAPSAASVHQVIQGLLNRDDGNVANTPLLSARSFQSAAENSPRHSILSQHSAAVLSQHSAAVSALPSARSLQGSMSQDVISIDGGASTSKSERGNLSYAAAEAAAKYLKNAPKTAGTATERSVPVPSAAAHVLPSGNRNSFSLEPRRQSVNLSVNRESLQKAMQALSGSSNSADLSGTTAADVSALLKARGNPALPDAFDPSVIGATLEVTLCTLHLVKNFWNCVLTFEQAFESFLYSVYADDIGEQHDAIDDDDGSMNEEDSMLLPDVISEGSALAETVTSQIARNKDVDANQEDDDPAIDMPPMKDMMVPAFRRDSIHVEKFFTPDLLKFMQSSSYIAETIQQPHDSHRQQQQQFQQDIQEHEHHPVSDAQPRALSEDWASEYSSVASTVEAEDEIDFSSARIDQNPDIREHLDSVPFLSQDLDAMHEAYTKAVSRLTNAMNNVKQVLRPPSPAPPVKMWNHEEEEDFVLKPRGKESSQNETRRGSSWSWYVA